MDLYEGREIDRDIEVTAGMVAIPKTILAKIDDADAFKATLTL